MSAQQFETTLAGDPSGPTGIVIPAEVIEGMAAGKKPAVVVKVNGYEYRSTVGVMGGTFMIPFSSDHRAKSGIKAGDAITVELTHDDQPRSVEVPDDLVRALSVAGKSEAFDKLSPSRKKEFVRQVVEAKAAETRLRRIEKVVSEL